MTKRVRMKKQLSLIALLASSPIYAAIENPPVFKTTSGNQENIIDLNIDFKVGGIYNPNTKQLDMVKLRQYIDPSKPLPSQFVGPMIIAQQGQTLKVNLKNNLKKDQQAYLDNCPDPITDINTPHCFNNTNLHTHGLWVDPGTNTNGTISDNVFAVIKPGEKINYEFKIDEQHPAGTYWYHPHLHGSTSIQVLSGMAGPLIIEGKKKPTQNTNGDIDVLLGNTLQQILLFQQIQYTCPTEGCTNQNPGGINEDYDTFGTPNDWSNSGRYTSINGSVLDTLKVQANRHYRWRMIHGGIRETIGLMIKEIPSNLLKESNGDVTSACRALGEFKDYQNDNEKDEEYNKKAREDFYNSSTSYQQFKKIEPLEFHTIAYDGITTKEIQTKKLSVLQPGYREDVLISFKPNKKYCIFDTKLVDKNEINKFNTLQETTVQQTLTLPQQHELYAQLLATVDVSESSIPYAPIQKYLVKLAKRHKLDDAIVKNIKQKKDNLRNFTPHESLINIDRAMVGKQELNFDINGRMLGIGDSKFNKADTRPYGQNANRYLKLESIDEWTLTSTNGGHPFHIHVNPFQIQSVYKTDKKNQRISGDLTLEKGTDLLFNGLNGVWKDTLFVPEGYEVVVRTKYEKYSGDFVLHCHILNHEDLGMMQNVRICNDPTSEECKKPFPSSHGATAQHSHSH